MQGWSLSLLLGVALLRRHGVPRRLREPFVAQLPFERFVACRSSAVPASDLENDELMAMLMRLQRIQTTIFIYVV